MYCLRLIMIVNLNSTTVLLKTINNANKRIIVHQGGARSSKTYSICQYLIVKALGEKPVNVTIARSRFTWLKNTAMADFFDVLNMLGLYDDKCYNKTDNIYTLNRSTFMFTGLDQSQKLRGKKQDYFWINEANECTLDDFRQVAMRTQRQVILDYNPSETHHWIYDHVLTRPDCKLIHSTFRDNTFLPGELVKEIKSLKDTDDEYWQVFGLGRKGKTRELIFPDYELYYTTPQHTRRAYGLDFGYNHPTALVQVDYKDGALYWTELLYESYLSTADIISRMRQLQIDRRTEIFADNAEPMLIAELIKAGFNVKKANKNVAQGIRQIKCNKIYVSADSRNLIKELNHYKWHKMPDGRLVDEPVKFLDDAVDAARYASVQIAQRPTSGLKFTLTRRN